MTGVLQKWGNSVALRIPKAALVDAKMEEGMKVVVRVHENTIVVEQNREHSYTLDGLLSAVTKANSHSELLDDSAQGKEVW